MAFHNVAYLVPHPRCWRIKVRVIRLWKMPSYLNPDFHSSIDMVLSDSLGVCISAHVTKFFFSKVTDFFEEGKIYVISDFCLSPNRGSYKTTIHPYKIKFQEKTLVEPVQDDPAISLYGFKFISFPDISARIYDDSFLFGNFTPRTIYNVRHPSRILINPDLEECHLFMSRFFDGPGDDVVDSNPTWYSDSSMELIENDILNSAHVKNLSALEKLSTDVKYCVILGVILDVDCNKGWYYNACPSCMKKVIHDDSGFYCISCGHMLMSVTPKFKVEFNVLDDSKCSTLKMFDREVAELVHCSAADLLEELVSELGVVKVIPERIQDLIGKRLLFKLKKSQDTFCQADPTFTVIGISENEDLIEKFKLYTEFNKVESVKEDKAVVKDPVKETELIDLDPNFGKISTSKRLNGDVDSPSPDSKKLKSVTVE